MSTTPIEYSAKSISWLDLDAPSRSPAMLMNRFLITLLTFASSTHVFAQSYNQPTEACKADLARLCADADGAYRKFKCLLEKDSEVSTDCKNEIQRFTQNRRQSVTRGGGALSSFGGMATFSSGIPLVSFEGRFTPSNSGAPGLNDYRFNASMPISKSPTHVASLSVAAGLLHLGDEVALTSGTIINKDWYRFEIGTQYTGILPEKKFWMLRGSVGLASDQTFGHLDNLAATFAAGYGYPSGNPKGFWMLMAFMTTNGSFANFIPLPGFIYSYRGEEFSGTFGFPINSLQWTPINPWLISFSLFGPNISSEIAYGTTEETQPFVGANWIQQNYIPSSRVESQDRLSVDEKKTYFGIRFPIMTLILAELQVGLAFDRKVYIGKGFLNHDRGLADLDKNAYVGWSIKAAL